MKRFLTLMFLFCILTSVQATNYYVATNGSDSNSGTINNPWRNISKAVSVLQAGDTVFIRAGTYFDWVNLGEGNSGNATNGYITYSGYQDEHVILDGSGQPSWHAGFLSGIMWEAVDYITIKY